MKENRYYYSTRDLLLMAALAALGGLASTYINFIGDFFQSILGFAGTTQWAAGFHVLWLILAVGLTQKQGTGTITGILKGAVELFTGNTHGLLVVLVDIVAGILVDLGLLAFRKRDHWLPYSIAGGIASASNVFVFQLFAAVPADILTYGLIGLIALMAFLSGFLFAGILGFALITTLRKSGVVKDQESREMKPGVLRYFFLGAVLLSALVFGYLKISRTGTGTVAITGAVESPYQFNAASSLVETESVEMPVGGVTMTYRGYPLQKILQLAQPEDDYELIVLHASDGYSFFITPEELKENPALLLQAQGKGNNQVYNMVGPETKKAWVNGVIEISLIPGRDLELSVNGGESIFFQPGNWVQEMDSTNLDVGLGTNKYQGVPLNLLFQQALEEGIHTEFLLTGNGGKQTTIPAGKVKSDSGIRLFIILTPENVTYAVAHMNGEVYLSNVESIKLK